MRQPPYAIAVDLGATNVRVALVSGTGKILEKLQERTAKKGKNGRVVTDQIVGMIGAVNRNAKGKKIHGVGIAAIGPLDYKRGGPIHSPNTQFSFVPLVVPLKERFALPVVLLNDCKAGVLGEHCFGTGKGVNNLVYIGISTGIGAGAIVDGKLLFGKEGNAAEIGHVVIDSMYRLACSCKRGFGHWEGLASGVNLPRFFKVWARMHRKNNASDTNSAEDIFLAARKGNTVYRDFLAEVGRINARAISDIIVAFDPELITLGGPVVLNNKAIMLTGIRPHIERFLKAPKIQITSLGEDINLLGAAAAVFDPSVTTFVRVLEKRTT
ncbi:MAG: ROK family protein [Candidatus Sungbacteria bacterium]|nr:ROK family protein [Candidatus Sungbacteria bacterium]